MTIPENTRLIPLTQGKFALVDADDFDRINLFKWHFLSGYAARSSVVEGRKKYFFMHREILNPKNDQQVDHINHDTLDNRKINLRACSKTQNLMNQKKSANKSSKFKGVVWHKQKGKWYARIVVNKKSISLGLFQTQEQAAIAYNEAAKTHFKEFAKLNDL